MDVWISRSARCAGLLVTLCGALLGCSEDEGAAARVSIILDTDANNEIDDQFAISYALLSEGRIDVQKITVNRTFAGGGVPEHAAEAQRVVTLCARNTEVIEGASGSYEEILPTLSRGDFDGRPAVEAIVDAAMEAEVKDGVPSLAVVAIGKLTNVALAMAYKPEIISRIRLVWLGSNWPAAGEYNLNSDPSALRAVLASTVAMEMVVVRHQEPSGSAAVILDETELLQRMPGLGPEPEAPITGRDGAVYDRMGDYLVGLFQATGNTERPLFDTAAIAILKDATLGTTQPLTGWQYGPQGWFQDPRNTRTITLWENFNRRAIIDDVFATLQANTP